MLYPSFGKRTGVDIFGMKRKRDKVAADKSAGANEDGEDDRGIKEREKSQVSNKFNADMELLRIEIDKYPGDHEVEVGPLNDRGIKEREKSQVSNKFNADLELLRIEIDKYPGDHEVEVGSLTSHSGKRHAANKAASSPHLNFTWTKFRCGKSLYILKKQDTISIMLTNNHHDIGWTQEGTARKYLDDRPINDKRVGRVLADWSMTDAHGNVSGGVSPSLRSTDDPRAREFAKNLLGCSWLG